MAGQGPLPAGAHLEAAPDGVDVVIGAPLLAREQPRLHHSLGAVEEEHKLRLDAGLRSKASPHCCEQPAHRRAHGLMPA
jgi:hypothetical protein